MTGRGSSLGGIPPQAVPAGGDPPPQPGVLDGPAAVLVDLDARAVTYANPLAVRLAPAAELPMALREWSVAVGLRDPEGGVIDVDEVLLARLAAGTAVAAELVAALAGDPAHARTPLRVVAVPLAGAPDALGRTALVVLLPLREEVGLPGPRSSALDLATRAVLASSTSFTISDATLPDAPLVWVNPAFEHTTGYPSAAVIGRNCRFLQGPGTDRAAVARVRAALDAGQPVEEVLLNYRADGEAFYNALTISPLLDGTGALTHYVGVQADVTARVQAAQERAATQARAEAALAAERVARQAAEAARADADRARAEAEEAHRAALAAQDRLGLLAEATGVLAGILDVEMAADQLCEVVVPRLADWAVLALDDGSSVRARHRHGREEALGRWAQLHPALLRAGPATTRVMTARVPLLLHDVGPGDLAPDTVGPAAEELAHLAGVLGTASVIVVPLVARRRLLGTLTLVRSQPERRFDDDDLAVASDLGRRAALALDNARLYAAEHETAVTLQRSLLPVLPVVAGLDTAAVYLPGDDRAEVGGDWYDVLALPDGATGLAIGDVMGHDLAAAAAMGQLRSVLRSHAWEGDRPSRALERLDRLVQGLGMAEMATCVYARLEGADGAPRRAPGEPATLTWSNAGHHAPLLRTPDGRVVDLDAGAGLVIGVSPGTGTGLAAGQERLQGRCTIEPGSVLLLFTDGLIERRGRDLEVGLSGVRERLAAHDPARGSAALTRDLARRLLERGLDDDACLLAVHVC